MAAKRREEFQQKIEDLTAEIGAIEDRLKQPSNRKRHLKTRVEPIYQYTHYHPTQLVAQLVRLRRWTQATSNAKTLELAQA